MDDLDKLHEIEKELDNLDDIGKLEFLKEHVDEFFYRIQIDNDSVVIYLGKDVNYDNPIFSYFNEYGDELLLTLFKFNKLNADFV